MGIFLMYHTIGGHFTFERVPFTFFDNLLAKLHLDFLFPVGRNNFDRIGHYLVGVFAYPLAEFFYRKKLVRKLWVAIILGVFALGFWAAFYEIIEMIYAISDGGVSGQSFFGAQGDIWDAQKDMFLDILGAITVFVLFGRYLKFEPKRRK
jgi:putative membrane protein